MAESPAKVPRKHEVVEILATLLLAVAAVATAWSSYQANRWNGEQVKAGSRTNALRMDKRPAPRACRRPRPKIDVATFIQWTNAYTTDNTKLQDFYRARFRDDFKPAFDAWIATKPLQNPTRLRHRSRWTSTNRSREPKPRVSTRPPPLQPARARQPPALGELHARGCAVRRGALLRRRGRPKLTSAPLRIFLLAFGAAILTGTVIWIATFPVSISV